MVFKNSGLGLGLIGLGKLGVFSLVTLWSCYITGPSILNALAPALLYIVK